jgi:ribosome-associated toxin RatA of RatAB toxin-antitoxin module
MRLLNPTPFEVCREVFIEASPSRVWEVLSDFEKWPEWTPSMSDVKILDAQPIGLGSRVRVKQPKLQACVLTITVWKPGAGFEWKTRSPGVCSSAVHWIHESPTGSRVTLGIRFHGVLAPLVRCLAGSLIENYVTLEAQGLKHRCEHTISSD